jgi:hypothetical protein
MSEIPAAFVSNSDLERIRTANPGAATEAERIAQLLLKGEETESDLLRLAELLYMVGEAAKAEGILVANSTDGDRLHALHRELFSAVEGDYNMALRGFSDQLGITLLRLRSFRLYSSVFSCSYLLSNADTEQWIRAILSSPFEARITYEPRTGIFADLYAAFDHYGPGAPVSRSIALRYERGMWVRG